ncbi:hypothetical protein HN371_12710 [Candidatus Poribacteria bacterium]|jgi:molybdopterin converting factor small subunit|nr:hypothetical protein [Candidatus Poribacteria bacterium]MBT5531856.1 hypothetical protein [Candidatus Poribacteria bacterium]MBT5711712.1 hypothetical protein [Candidatus Poribacteria bacterium]MBT7097243.1 hypothetical protein [Candidatus Poribacteria bacterium]MBT7806340.1 hypothetical protein [Candidatus Poribacteria bacterium]
MQVTVRCSGQLRAALGTSSVILELASGASVADAVAAVADADADAAGVRPMLLDEAGAIQRTLVVAVGSTQVADATGHALVDGDTVTILHPISGG